MSSVREQIVDFVSTRIVQPTIVVDPFGRPVVTPSEYNFGGPYSAELERIARAASAASGVVPTPEELTAQAAARLQAQAEPEAPGGPQAEE